MVQMEQASLPQQYDLSWELVSKAKVTDMCCMSNVVATDFVSGWM